MFYKYSMLCFDFLHGVNKTNPFYTMMKRKLHPQPNISGQHSSAESVGYKETASAICLAPFLLYCIIYTRQS